jgi:hypothetical protein
VCLCAHSRELQASDCAGRDYHGCSHCFPLRALPSFFLVKKREEDEALVVGVASLQEGERGVTFACSPYPAAAAAVAVVDGERDDGGDEAKPGLAVSRMWPALGLIAWTPLDCHCRLRCTARVHLGDDPVTSGRCPLQPPRSSSCWLYHLLPRSTTQSD